MTGTAPEPAVSRDGPRSAPLSRLYRTQRPTPAATSGSSPDPCYRALSPAPERQSLLLSLAWRRRRTLSALTGSGLWNRWPLELSGPSWCAELEQGLFVRQFRTERTASGSRYVLSEEQC